jgi:hypothetical protein
MLRTSTAVTGAARGLSEVSAINGQMSVLETKIAEDLATFRR